ncbi:hypothetical protein [Chryseolinea soli]|uniref:Uncharacterized protein n=1 Tax=Chryseolinea soli TaxID=2321403 RepID=A0A385SSH1_9BACT|nr:hypothetical protein [Chryseolinea soli]AYB32945.1 hypothetical protein D4L85_21230 [Chryseolinea soli]
MTTNRIIAVLNGIVAWIIVPISILTTFVLGLLVSITFGLLLFPISLIWIVLFYGPLIGLSWFYEKARFLRILTSVVGIPMAVVGSAFVTLMPSMGDTESRASKLLACDVFPYTWHLYHFAKADPLIKYSNGYDDLLRIFNKIDRRDIPTNEYIIKMKVDNGWH